MKNKKVLNIREDIASRKTKQPSTLGHFLYKLVMGAHSLKFKQKITITDDVRKCKTGCFVVFNHLSRLDHLYVLNTVYPRKFNMLAGYNEFFRSHLHWVFEHQHILPKKNYCNEIQNTKQMLTIVKAGGCVSFAPEGLASNDGQNKPVVPGTGKLLKHCKVPVYHLSLHGEYLQNTKVCLDERIGKTFAEMKILFTPEQLERMSVEEIDDALNEAFRRDEYGWQKEKQIKWKTKGRICENLHELLFECPKCHKLFSTIGKGNEIICANCGNGSKMDDYYNFIPFESSIIPETVTEWVNNQRIHIIDKIREDENFEFVENVELGILPNDHYLKDLKVSEIVTKGKFIVNHEGVRFTSFDGENKEYDFFLDYNKIFTTFTVKDSKSFSFYVDGEFMEFIPERPASLYINYLIEEMHRLHINYYKNFKWYDYMYEGKKLGIDKK